MERDRFGLMNGCLASLDEEDYTTFTYEEDEEMLVSDCKNCKLRDVCDMDIDFCEEYEKEI